MGGMSAQIPIKNDTAANDRVSDKVRQDKLREVTAGHDGTWVAHPGLIPIAMKVFDEHMKGPNQVCTASCMPKDTGDGRRGGGSGNGEEMDHELMGAVPQQARRGGCHRQAVGGSAGAWQDHRAGRSGQHYCVGLFTFTLLMPISRESIVSRIV